MFDDSDGRIKRPVRKALSVGFRKIDIDIRPIFRY